MLEVVESIARSSAATICGIVRDLDRAKRRQGGRSQSPH
jgi:hypothetical protein